jgi:hypothetical protein
MITFITKRKSPKVIIVRGRVKIVIIGLTNAFRSASTMEKIIAVVNECIDT